jgi:hypothetical protein
MKQRKPMEIKIKYDNDYEWRIEWSNPMNGLRYVATYETIEELNKIVKQFKEDNLKTNPKDV